MRLTDLSIKQLPIPEKGQKTYFEGSGFGVRVSHGGTKSFVQMYGSDRRMKTIGRYPQISLKSARKEAQAFLGRDTPENRILSYSEASERFLSESATKHKPQTTTDYRRHLNYLGFKKSLPEISRAEVLREIAKLAGQPVTQNHTFDTAVNFFNWCVRNEYLTRSPLQGEKKPAPKRHRERILTPEELRIVYKRALDYPFPYGPFVRLLTLTGQRRSEILHLTWDDVGETLKFHDTKNRTDHEIPLLPMARAIIEDIPERKHYLFEYKKSGIPFGAFNKHKIEFDKAINVGGYRLHDLRRTFSSTMAMLGTPLHVTEKILNHKSGTISGVQAIYNRYTFVPEMEDALETYETYIRGLLDG